MNKVTAVTVEMVTFSLPKTHFGFVSPYPTHPKSRLTDDTGLCTLDFKFLSVID
jgi:hypothetical protein